MKRITDLHPYRMTRTKNGTVKQYIDFPAIQRSTVYAAGAQAVATSAAGMLSYYTASAGTTAASAPVFPASGTVVDGGVTWTFGGLATMNFKRYKGEPARTNSFLNSTAPVTQDITTTAQQYVVTVLGSGTVTLSGTATGVASQSSPLVVTATAGTLTCTCAGTLTWVNVQTGAFPTSFIETAGTTVTRAATVLSLPSTNVLRDQNCAVFGEVVPSAGGQSVTYVFNCEVDANNRIGIALTAAAIYLPKVIANVSHTPARSFIHAANTPFQYQAFWSDQGMAIRTRSLTAGVWSAWSAWDTNANTAAAPIAATYEIGSQAGVSQFAGNFPEFRTLFLPTKATLAEYQTYCENEANWGGNL